MTSIYFRIGDYKFAIRNCTDQKRDEKVARKEAKKIIEDIKLYKLPSPARKEAYLFKDIEQLLGFRQGKW